MSVTVILPSIVPEFTRACIDTMRFVNPAQVPDPAHEHRTHGDIVEVNGNTWTAGKPDVRLVVVYNTVEDNHGVAGSWNIGIRAMYEHGHDWLAVLSAGVRFGPKGGRDFLGWLPTFKEARPDVLVVEAGGGLGWHCLAFRREAFDLVGGLDPIWWPAYYEDNDWSHRYQIATGRDSRAPGFVGPLWPKVEVDAMLEQVAHGIKQGGVHVDMAALERQYVDKWGGVSPHETFTHPYNDQTLDWRFVGPYEPSRV